MKFSCEKYVLQQAALSTARAAASKSPLPTLEGLLIQAGEGVARHVVAEAGDDAQRRGGVREVRRADRDRRRAGEQELDCVLRLVDSAHREDRKLRRLVRVVDELDCGGMDSAP